jgi:nitrate/nitrite-specific signal transduction histidine kinase
MEQVRRQHVGTFFIKRSLQMRLIVKIVVAAILATFVCSCTLLLVYYFKYDSVLLYQMDKLANLTKENIIFIILPSLLISSLVNFVLAVGLGMYASRKYAVPIYKLEQWAGLVRQGKINAQIQFREQHELKELSECCNSLTRELKEKFVVIQQQTELLKERFKDSAELQKIEDVLSTLQIHDEPIKINTTMMRISVDGK